MKCKSVIIGFLVLCSLVGVCDEKRAAPRGVEYCRRMMDERSYEGVWKAEGFGLALKKDGTGTFVFQNESFALKWTADQKGHLDIVLHVQKELTVRKNVAYDADSDVMVLPLTDKSATGFSGRLPFAAIDEREPAPSEKDQLNAKDTSRNASNVAWTSAKDLPSMLQLIAERKRWETVDDVYPRISMEPDYMFSDRLDVIIRTGRYDSSLGPASRNCEGRDVSYSDEAPEAQRGWKREHCRSFVEELRKLGVSFDRSSCDYQEPFRYSREDEIGVLVGQDKLPRFREILERWMQDGKYPRKCRVVHAKCMDEEQR